MPGTATIAVLLIVTAAVREAAGTVRAGLALAGFTRRRAARFGLARRRSVVRRLGRHGTVDRRGLASVTEGRRRSGPVRCVAPRRRRRWRRVGLISGDGDFHT